MDREPTSAKEFAPASAHIGPERVGLRLQEALVDLFPDWLPSRKSCRKAIDRGEVCCNGKVSGTALRMAEGDLIEYRPQRWDAPDPGPNAPKHLRVIRPKSAEYAFVWKPAGLATSGPGLWNLAGVIAHQALHGSDTEQQALRPHQPDGMPIPRPVHRLDRATSGWVCLALTLRAARSLSEAFAERRVDKRYLALAAGSVMDGHSEVALDGQTARTNWRRLGHGPLPVHGEATLLEVRPTTGRTHQIRRHLADLGHPLVGEDVHAAPGVALEDAPRYTGQGLFLCAMALSIPAGDHGPSAEVTAPVPRKYKRIRWAADALERHGCS